MKSLKYIVIFIILFSGIALAEEGNYKKMSADALEQLKTIKKIPFAKTTNPGAQWFPDAGFGLFIHWGIHSVAGLEPSWTMLKNCPWMENVPEYQGEKYYSLLTQFNPQNYDPEKWIEAAKKAGMQYAVITAKHHDGYALWPSEYTKYGVKQYLDGRDLLKPFIDACRKNGLKVGLYFSPRDWSYPGFPIDMDFKNYGKDPYNRTPEQNQKDFDEFYKYTVGQLSEILTRYGKLDVLWFDGVDWPGIKDTHVDETIAWVRKLQPQIVINPRWENKGDFETPEVNLPEKAPEGWWENCISWSGHWGYSPNVPFKTDEWVLERLSTIRSWGGNLLLNVGPAPDGTMRPEYYERQQELAEWMSHSKKSLIGAGSCREWKNFTDMPVTTNKAKTWYFHVLPAHGNDVVVKNAGEPVKITFLKTGESIPFDWKRDSQILKFSVPKDKRTKLDDVVAVEWKTLPEIKK